MNIKLSGEIPSRIRFKDGEGAATPGAVADPSESGLPDYFTNDARDKEMADIISKRNGATDPAPKEEVLSDDLKEEPIQNGAKAHSLEDEDEPLGLSLPKRKQEPTPPKPGEPAKPVVPPAKDKVAELEKIQPPKGIAQRTQAGWDELKSTSAKLINAERARATGLEKQLADLQGAHQEELKKLQTENQELRGYRAVIDVQSDPEFVEKYQKPIDTQKASMTAILKKYNLTDDDLKSVDLENPEVVEYLAENVEKRNKTDAQVLRSKAQRIAEVKADSAAELANAKTKHGELLAERTKKTVNQKAETQARLGKHLEDVAGMKSAEGDPQFPFVTIMKTPPDATPEEIAQIEKHNVFATENREKIMHFAQQEEPEKKIQVATAAALSGVYRKQLNFVLKKLDRLQNEFNRVTNASEPKKGSRVPMPSGGGANGAAPETKVDVNQSVDDALAEYFPGRFKR